MIKLKNGVMAGLFILSIGSAWADEAVTANKDTSMTAPAPAAAMPVATPGRKAKKKMKKKAMKTVWVCPMGDYTGDKPGKCPNCQMDLVKKEVPVDNTAAPAPAKDMKMN